MSHEFKLHRYVDQLISSLGISGLPNCPGAEVLTEVLEKNAGFSQITQASAASAKKKMADLADDPEAFEAKYDELKNRNVKELSSLVPLMLRIKKDPQIQALLTHNNSNRTISDPLAQGDAALTASNRAALTTPMHKSPTPVDNGNLSENYFEEVRMEVFKKANTIDPDLPSDPGRRTASRKKLKARTLSMPSWLSNRPCLTMDFSTDHVLDHHCSDLGRMSRTQQEACILTDLLYCLEGISGRYIRAETLEHRHGVRVFKVDEALDGSLREIVNRIVPLCSQYSSVVRFLEDQFEFSNGLVKQALAASFRTILNDYMILMTQLEQQHKKGKLSLQNLWFYLQSPLHTFTILSTIVTSINKGNLEGGSVLSFLHEKIPSYLGNPKSQQLCTHITKAACVPYFQILEKWICKGIIVDHYNEFMIEEDDAFKKEKLGHDFTDAYWDKKYRVRQANTPSFLTHVVDKVLNTGKYLNVIRQCGRDVSSSQSGTGTEYSVEGGAYVEVIDRNFRWASSLLLDLLVKEMDLMTRLRSLKHYFMLDQGDFIVQFMDLAEGELKKPMDDILLPRLETLLELALRTSTSNVDPYKDDLKVDLLPFDLITQLFKILSIETKQEKEYHRLEPTDLHLSGLESFSFDYVVRWPVSLVLNRKALTRYQILSRHLFYSMHVERQLCNVWMKDKGLKGSCHSATVRHVRSIANALLQRMLNFVRNLQYYSMFEVIEPLWQQFEREMASVSNVDEVLKLHNNLLNDCLKHCMLQNPRLLKVLHKLMVICVTFCNFMQKLSGHLSFVDDQQDDAATFSNASKKPSSSSTSSSPSGGGGGKSSNERTIATFDHNFSKHLVELLNNIVELSGKNSQQRLIHFVQKLDYNGFYKKEMDKMSAARTLLTTSSSSSSQHRASTSSASSVRLLNI